MILRNNKKIVDEYLAERIDQVSDASVKLDEIQLTVFLYYADETPFHELPKKLPSFVSWLKTPEARRDGKDEPLSNEYRRKCLSTARRFLEWYREVYECKSISSRWLKNLKCKKEPDSGEPVCFTLDEMLRIANTPAKTLVEQRTRAGCALMFLSGMRIKAFVTAPIRAINLDTLKVRQWPSLGVHTKNGKKAETNILDIPEASILLEIVQAWDKKVRDALSPDQMWYAPISPKTGGLDPVAVVGNCRDSNFSKNLAEFLEKANLEQKSSHKFRHGHIQFLRNRATTYKELEAIANNTMQTMATMLQYGRLNSEQTNLEIEALCKRNSQSAAALPTLSGDMSLVLAQLQTLQQQQEQMMALMAQSSAKGNI
jgi:site-specific recombinase XerC